MNGKERVLAALSHKEPDRVPIYDALMIPTLMNWYNQGLDMDENPTDVFDHDISIFFSDCTPQFEYEVIKEDDEYLTVMDIFGQHSRSSKAEMTIMPQVMDVAVKNKEDWNSFKDRLIVNDFRLEGFKIVWNNFPGGRLSKQETLDNLNKHHSNGRFNLLFMITGYDIIQMYLGSERMLMALLEDQAWCKEMFDYIADFTIDLFDFYQKNNFKFDGILLGNDMGYKDAPLFSPDIYKKILFPSDKMMCDYFHSKDLPVFLHSDGYIKDFIPDLIDAGFDCLQPIEVKSGMDLLKLKEEYGSKISFMGGVDTLVFSTNDDAKIEEEIKNKVGNARRGGGYIYQIDHSVPPGVDFEQYRRIIELVKKYGTYK